MNSDLNSLISVIVPVYNDADFLHRCIESLLKQTYENIDIVIIDDGSDDGSARICDEYEQKDNRVQVYHQHYEGVSSARNKGLELAKGDYIIFLDGDDEADPQYVEKLYKTLVSNELDIAQCCLIRIKNGERINELPCTDEVRIFSGLDMQMKIFERNRYFTMCLCGKLFKRDLFAGLLFPVGRINEDESLIYILMYRAERVGVIDDYLYYYHYNKSSITEKQYNIHRLDSFYMLEEKYRFYVENGLTEFADKTANEYFSQMSVVFYHAKTDIPNRRAIQKKAKELYIQDRKAILENASLDKIRWIFMKMSYVSFGFVKLYGKLLKFYLK